MVMNSAGYFPLGQHPVEIPVLYLHSPAAPRVIRFLGGDVLRHLLPYPHGRPGIDGVEINPRQAEADGRLPIRLVHGTYLLNRFGFHPGLETPEIACCRAEGIPDAPGALEFPIVLRQPCIFILSGYEV